MNNKLLLFLFIGFLLFSTNSYSNPLQGDYIVGTGGNYTTIGAAVAALNSSGVSGQVRFRILAGNYAESNTLGPFANSNSSNTVTFESFDNLASSVVITSPSEFVFRFENAKHYIIRALTIQNISMHDSCQNLKIADNNFTNHSITAGSFGDPILALNITGNKNLAGIMISTANTQVQSIRITHNDFSPLFSSLTLDNITDLTVMENTNLATMIADHITNFVFANNELYSSNVYDNIIKIRWCFTIIMKNNFIQSEDQTAGSYFYNSNNFICANNTFRNQGNYTTLTCDSCSIDLQNNIYQNSSPGNAVSYRFNIGVSSDYNTYYRGLFDYFIEVNGNQMSIQEYQNYTGNDMHSKQRAVNFVSSVNSHLDPVHSGDELLIGVPLAEVTEDIDEEPRHSLYPYQGADELSQILPVELSSFTSIVSDYDVVLSWTTESENNNAGFEVERKEEEIWQAIGFVNGNGNSNTPKKYSYIDRNLNTGIYYYRLKQIDLNGNFEYHNLINEVVIGIPDKFSLSQNYPNPFNPETNISYSIPSEQFVRLIIYDLTGKEILTLINEVKPPGRYEITFNATSLSSGIYFYKIAAGSFEEVKRMTVVK